MIPALFAACAAGLVPPFLAAVFLEDVNRPTRKFLFSVTAVLILGSALFVGGTATRRGMTPAVLCMVAMECVAAGALLCIDVHLKDAQVHPPVPGPQVSLPLRTLFASALTLGAALLALYHVGSLERLGPQASEALEALTPKAFDPLVLLRRPEERSCVLGTERPTFKKDRIVGCLVPHDWQIHSRLEPFQECPDEATLTANVPVMVITHDLGNDRWCLARSTTGEQLTTPVCVVGLACTE